MVREETAATHLRHHLADKISLHRRQTSFAWRIQGKNRSSMYLTRLSKHSWRGGENQALVSTFYLLEGSACLCIPSRDRRVSVFQSDDSFSWRWRRPSRQGFKIIENVIKAKRFQLSNKSLRELAEDLGLLHPLVISCFVQLTEKFKSERPRYKRIIYQLLWDYSNDDETQWPQVVLFRAQRSFH